MLKINNILSTIENIEIDWVTLTSTDRGVFREKVAVFMISGENDKNEQIKLDIETTLQGYKLEKVKINNAINLKEFISDVIYIIDGIAYLDLSDKIEEEIVVSLLKINNEKYIINVQSSTIDFSYESEVSIKL